MLTFYCFLLSLTKVHGEDSPREGKDLVYEAMKMRTGTWRPWDRDRVEIVGGGILEKKMLGNMDGIEDREGMLHESREMQCCDELSLESFGGVLECHPYVMGEYKKIGSCSGRSFYQHKNNTDIFLYYACGAWYVGLEIGVCGGWILAKSTEICGSARHDSPWKFFNNAILEEDPTFQVLERCTFQNDFFPIPPKPTMTPQYWPHQNHQIQAQRPQLTQGYPQEYPQQIAQYIPTSQPSYSPSSSSVKHEHYHYHYPTKDNYNSGNHPDTDNALSASRQGLITLQTYKQNQSPLALAPSYVYSQPLQMSSGSKYKYQYKGDPYKKRAEDSDEEGEYKSYFPIGRSETALEEPENSTEMDETSDQVDETTQEPVSDKNNRKMD